MTIEQLDSESGRKTFVFCATHQDVLMPLPKGAIVIELGKLEANFTQDYGICNAYELIEGGARDHKYLGHLLASFAIAKLLRQMRARDTDLIHYCFYRKFVSAKKFGGQSRTYPGMHIVAPTELPKKLDEIFPSLPENQEFLVARPIPLDLLLRQYQVNHYLPDFLRFIAIACENGVISPRDATKLLLHRRLIPGGSELGIMPVKFFLSMTDKLNEISYRFLDELPENRRILSPTEFRPKENVGQSMTRPLAYCAERFTSFLLEKHLHDLYGGSLPEYLFGTIHTIGSSDRQYVPSRRE
jgi:hypothetical protein